MINIEVPHGFRLRVARITAMPYQWDINPRRDYDHASELMFFSSRRGESDRNASLSWALSPIMDALNGKYTKRHRAWKKYRADMDAVKKSTIKLQEVAPKYLGIIQKLEVYKERMLLLRLWAARSYGVPYTNNNEDPRVWVVAEYNALLPEFRRMTDVESRYKTLVNVVKHTPLPPDNVDDRDWVDDQCLSGCDLLDTLYQEWPDLVTKHIPVWASINNGQDTQYDFFAAESTCDGLFWIRADLMKKEHPSLFTKSGRLRRGVFRRFAGDEKRSAAAHIKAFADMELSEYAAYADGSAIELMTEVLPLDTVLPTKISPGMLDRDAIEGLRPLFSYACTDNMSGPWFRTNHNRDFDVERAVADALPSSMIFSTKHTLFQSSYDVAGHLHWEYRHGYPDGEGEWHYFAFIERIPPCDQLELPLGDV